MASLRLSLVPADAIVMAQSACRRVRAETWPTRPITIVLSFAAGTGDIFARPFAEFASKQLGQPVIVEARQGGGGVVAPISVAKAALRLTGDWTVDLAPDHRSIDWVRREKDFSPIGLVGDTPNVILGGAKFPARSMKELIAWAKQNPGLLTIGHSGIGTMGHLAALLLAFDSGVCNYISYRNNGQMMVDLLGGQIDVAVAAYSPQLKAARIMSVMAAEPVEFLPGVPSMREAGFPGICASTWYALMGPRNLPHDIVTKLNAILNDFLRLDDMKQQLKLFGFRPIGGSPEDLTKRMAEDKVLWDKVIKDANVKLNDLQ